MSTVKQIAAALAALSLVLGGSMALTEEDTQVDGGRTETRLDLPREIRSENIVSFSLILQDPREYEPDEETRDGTGEVITASSMRLEKDAGGILRIRASGGGPATGHRDGSAFFVEFTTPDRGYTAKLQELIQKHGMIADNGHYSHTAGLPSGDGDQLRVIYDSGEQIGKGSNNSRILSRQAALDVFALFREITREAGHDFTTEGSTRALYDDPTTEWLQGIWEGHHFGTPCQVRFAGRHVQITYGGSLTDDTDYVIVDGWVRPDTPSARKGGHAVFSALTGMSKKNSFTLNAGVYRNGASSSFELRKVTAKEEAEAR